MPYEINNQIAMLRQHLREIPQDTDALSLLASLYMAIGKYTDALKTAKKILVLRPEDYETLYLIAKAYEAIGQDKKSFSFLEKVLQINENHSRAHIDEAYYFEKQKQLKERIACLEKAIQCCREQDDSLLSTALMELGGDYIRLGDIAAGKTCFLDTTVAAASFEEKRAAYSSYLMSTNYDEALSDDAMLTEHEKYSFLLNNEETFQHEVPVGKKKLRIGYLSTDFYHHVMAYFLYPLLHRYNRQDFEVICYRRNEFTDDATDQLQASDTIWRDISAMDAKDAANQIHQDQIDILVELGGHTAGNGLDILAYKPAPLQICGIGYINTTGLKFIDYFLTDTNVDPPGKNDEFFTEKLLRLPHSHWSYAKRLDAPDCGKTAARENGYITFGSFNNFAKTTDEMLLLWREILEKVPGSRLILKSKIFGYAYGREYIGDRLSALGFSLERIDLRPATATHMQEYREVDIALDTSPYVGGATTCEALYMGVPVITLEKDRHASRFGYSMLKAIELEECIASTKEDYVMKAVDLASDLDHLDELHQGQLREKMLDSPLMDPIIYMSDLENAYRKIWQDLVAAK